MTRSEYVDKRDWDEYNEKLVRRVELYFSFEFLDSLAKDIAQMNEGKVGRRYEFPEPFIQHLMILECGLARSPQSLYDNNCYTITIVIHANFGKNALVEKKRGLGWKY
jgi:hypothetical protein